MNSSSEVFNIRQAAAFIGAHEQTVRRLARRGPSMSDSLKQATQYAPLMLLAKPAEPRQLEQTGRRSAAMKLTYNRGREPIEVSTGEVKTSSDGLLRASALGSCVAVAILDVEASTGGLAHVMLPGASPDGRQTEHTKYAEDGIRELAHALAAHGARPERLVACVVGGGNILGRDDDTVCEANIASVTGILEKMQIPIAAREVGGTERRSISVDVAAAKIFYTVGDSASELLWPSRDAHWAGGEKTNDTNNQGRSPTRE